MYLVTAARGHLHDSALSATKQGGRDEFSLLKSSRIGVGHAGVAMRHSTKPREVWRPGRGDTFVVFFDLTKCWTALYAKTWIKLSLPQRVRADRARGRARKENVDDAR